MNTWWFYLLVVVCAVILDLLFMLLSRRYFSASALEKQDLRPVTLGGRPSALFSMLLRGPVILYRKRPRSLPIALTGWFAPRAHTLSLLFAFTGLFLIGVGQIARENWLYRNGSSLIVLGAGLLLLTLGLAALQYAAGNTLLIPDQPESASAQANSSPDQLALPWVSPAQALLLAGGLLLLFATQLSSPRWLSAGWLAVGALQIASGALTLQRRVPAWLTRLLAWPVKRMGLTPDRVIFLICGIMLSITATALAGTNHRMIRPAAAVMAWLCGILLAVLGAWRPARFSIQQIPWRPIAIGVGLALLSLPFRAIQTDVLPLGFTGDEGSAGANAVRFLNGEVNNIFNTGWFEFPSLFFFIQSLFIAIFRQTAEAVRFSAVFAGTLGVAVTYWAARALFGRRAALLAGLFLICFHFHIHFSRIGLNNIWDALFFTWVLGALWVGWQRRSRGAFTLAGLGLGLSLYFYVSARVLVLLVPLLGLLFCWLGRRRILSYLAQYILVMWLALTVALPLGWVFVTNPVTFNAPLNRVKVSDKWLNYETQITGHNETQLWQNQLLLSVQAYTDIPTRHLYAPGTPILLTLPAILFWVGAAVLLTRWRDPRLWLLGGWLGSIAAAAALSQGTPAGHRYIAAAPALAMMVGVGLSGLMAMVEQLSSRKWAGVLLATCLLAVIGMREARTYLPYATSPAFGGSHNMVAQALAEILMREPDTRLVYFFGDSGMDYPQPQLRYLAPGVKWIDVVKTDDWRTSWVTRPGDEPCLFVFLLERKNQLALILAEYPGGQVSTVYDPEHTLLFWLYDPHPPFAQPEVVTMKTFHWRDD